MNEETTPAKPPRPVLPAKPSENNEERPVRPSRLFCLLYPWLKLLLLCLARLLSPGFHVSGTRNVPRRGPLLMAPNHISDSDPPFVHAASPRRLWFMAKEEIFEIRWLGPMIRFFGAFPVEPNGADRAALRYAGALLDNRQAVVVFPEGQCSPSGEFAPILPGAVMLALRSRVPVVPVGIWNTQCVIPYGSTVPRPTLSRVAVHFGPPVRFDDLAALDKKEAREAATERLQTAIAAARDVARTAAGAASTRS